MKNVKVNIISFVAVFVLPALFVTESLAFDDAGRVMFVAGKATIVNASGLERIARKGDSLRQGDRLVTSDKGMIQVKMRDDGIMAVRPGTDLKLNDMVPQLNNTDGPSQALLLTRGGVRVLTGDNARNKLGYLIKTVATSIGLRDGDTEALVIPAPKPAAEHGADSTPAGTYNRVYAGKGVIQGAAGNVLSLTANQISYTPSVRDAPVLVASLPPSYIDTVIPTQLAGDAKPTLVAAPAPVLAAPIIVPATPINVAPPTLVSLAPLPVALAPIGVTTPPPVMIAPPTLVLNPILVMQPVVIAPPPPPPVITTTILTPSITPTPTVISTIGTRTGTFCIVGKTC